MILVTCNESLCALRPAVSFQSYLLLDAVYHVPCTSIKAAGGGGGGLEAQLRQKVDGML